MDLKDLNGPTNLSQQLIRTGRGYLNRPADFGQANRSFGNMIANPQLMQMGGGNVLDPTQANSAAGTSYLNERSNIASTDLQQKASFADLMARAGTNVGALMAAMTQLKAMQQGGQNSLMSGLGGFL